MLYKCKLKLKNNFHPLPEHEKVKMKVHSLKKRKQNDKQVSF